ncbi:MAG: glycosyltransferase family 4 protein [Rhodoferax sp.]|nr:glycosyltransferase family 4 protein [Rhodoferax sp.]
MNIAIVAPSPVPFGIGGAENLWSGWLAALNAQPGVEAELIKLPSPERNFWEILASYRQFAYLDLRHFDRIISTKYPAWMVSHPDHHVFLQHKLRGLYDTWPTGLATTLPGPQPPEVSNLLRLLERSSHSRQALDDIFACIDVLRHAAPGLPTGLFALPGALLRRIVHALDGIGLARTAIRRYAAISATVAARADYFPADVPTHEVQVLHHPTLVRTLPALGSPLVPPGAIFTASRLDAPKRMDWVVQAYLKAKVDVPLVIAGDGPQRQLLNDLARDHPHIHLVGRLTDAELASAYQGALFVPFVPDREDYGLITLEALQAGKPVLTCADAGGVTELVQHEVNGLIVPPDVPSLAAAIRRLSVDAELRNHLAARAQPSVAHIAWPALAQAFCRPYPRIAVINTFSIYPAQGGGQLRLLHLYRELARQADVRMVNLSHDAPQATQRYLAPGLQERVVPMTAAHRAHEAALKEQLKASCVDVSAMLHPELSPDWLTEIASACAWADVVVSSHVYAYPAIRQVWQGPVVYESHNVEADLKAAIFGHAVATLEQVRSVEQICAHQAPLVLCCSPEDAVRMQQLYQLPVLPDTAPNGVDVRAFPQLQAFERQAVRQRMRLDQQAIALFVASLHGPNIDALLALLPVVRNCPEVLFVIIGSVCHAAVLPAASELPANLCLMGRLSDSELRVWLAAAHVGLNPVVSGSGTNLKMLEYAAAGLPMLSTPFGARGGLFIAGEHYVAAEMPVFAQTLRHMLAPAQAHACQTMAEAARQRVADAGDWRIIARHMWEALAKVLPASDGTDKNHE